MKHATILATVFLLALGAAASDVKYTQEMQMGQGVPAMRTTVYVKGDLQREDMNMMGMGDFSRINNCSTQRVTMLNPRCQAYYVVSGGSEPSAPAAGAQPAARGGGVVKVNATYRDTGERQTMLGYPARHLVLKTTMDGTPNSCSPGHWEMESDTWMIDLPALPACASQMAQRPPTRDTGGCADRVEYTTKGDAATGLPVKTTMTVTSSNGQRQTIVSEVKEISTATLDAALFQVPGGYKQMNSTQELMTCGMNAAGPAGMAGALAAAQQQARQAQAQAAAGEATAAQPAAGVVRIGIVFNDRAKKLDASTVTRQLVDGIRQHQGFDAVRIEATSPADVQKQAADQKCSFILYADVQEARTAAPRLGGILGRAAGVGGSVQPTQNIRMDYRLTTVQPPDQQVAKDTLNHSEQTVSLDQAVTSFMQKTADRAVSDAARYRK